MVRLRQKKIVTLTLKASTLMEVLIAMVILLCVFGIGMMIFANLDRSSSNLESRVVREQLRALAGQYEKEAIENGELQVDSIAYYLEESPIDGVEDHKRLTIYAERIVNGELVDSLVHIVPVLNTTKL